MPTISSSQVPAPKSWEEFEDLALSAAKLRWSSSDFFRHGRQGQKQHGVDIWGHDDDDRHIGVQCKNTVGGLLLATVEAEVSNAEKFTPELDHLYIATTAPRDVSLQKSVRMLSQQRKEAGKFRVDILFWEDVCHDLAKDARVFFAHYPQLKAEHSTAREHDKVLFNGLTSLLRSDGVIGFLNRTNMAGFAFRSAELDPLREFYYEWNAPEREFITPELEKLRQELWSKVDAYYGTISRETFATRSNVDFQTVPPEWEIDQPERFWRVVNLLHTLAAEIVRVHAEFVRTGRAKLVGE